MNDTPGFLNSIHPSIHFLFLLHRIQGCREAGAHPSCHWARGRVQPGGVASASQGQHKDKSVKQPSTNWFLNFLSNFFPNWIFMGGAQQKKSYDLKCRNKHNCSTSEWNFSMIKESLAKNQCVLASLLKYCSTVTKRTNERKPFQSDNFSFVKAFCYISSNIEATYSCSSWNIQPATMMPFHCKICLPICFLTIATFESHHDQKYKLMS